MGQANRERGASLPIPTQVEVVYKVELSNVQLSGVKHVATANMPEEIYTSQRMVIKDTSGNLDESSWKLD